MRSSDTYGSSKSNQEKIWQGIQEMYTMWSDARRDTQVRINGMPPLLQGDSIQVGFQEIQLMTHEDILFVCIGWKP